MKSDKTLEIYILIKASQLLRYNIPPVSTNFSCEIDK